MYGDDVELVLEHPLLFVEFVGFGSIVATSVPGIRGFRSRLAVLVARISGLGSKKMRCWFQIDDFCSRNGWFRFQE